MKYCVAAGLTVLVGACSGASDPGDGLPAAAGGPSRGGAPAAGDPSAAMFDPNRVLAVDIQLPSSDWDVLRHQARNFFDIFGSCLKARGEGPYTYFKAKVTIDGEVIENVGLRKKGFFGSVDSDRPALKLSFSEYEMDRRFHGMTGMTLNNAKQDDSIVKQCLGYDLLAAAGVPSPRCNFASVSVNGEKMGVFVHVESIKKDFLKRTFGNDDGNLYEGALSDFRPEWVNTFDRKTNESDLNRDDILELSKAAALPDAELVAGLQKHIDLDRFVNFWAAEVLLRHSDGYANNANNFYVYANQRTRKLEFIPWGIDAILGGELPDSLNPEKEIVFDRGQLANRLYNLPQIRQQYLDRLGQLLDQVWDEPKLLAEVDRMQALITPHLLPGQESGTDAAIKEVRAFISSRRAGLQMGLKTPPPRSGEVMKPLCLTDLGTSSGQFSTTWEAPEDKPGTGSFTLTVNGETTTFKAFTGAGIEDDEEEPKIAVSLFAPTSVPGEFMIVYIAVEDERKFKPGQTLAFDWIDAAGYALRFRPDEPDAEPELVGLLGEGSLTFTAASQADRQPVVGSFSAKLYDTDLFGK